MSIRRANREYYDRREGLKAAGYSSTLSFAIPEKLRIVINRMWEEGLRGEYSSIAALCRDALMARLETLAKDFHPNHGKAIKRIYSLIRRYRELDEYHYVIAATEGAVHRLLEIGHSRDAEELCHDILAEIDTMPAGEWQQTYRQDMLRKFPQLTRRAGTVPHMPTTLPGEGPIIDSATTEWAAAQEDALWAEYEHAMKED